MSDTIKDERHVPITISLPPTTMEQLASLAERYDRSRSWVVKKAVQIFYDCHLHGRYPNAADLQVIIGPSPPVILPSVAPEDDDRA